MRIKADAERVATLLRNFDLSLAIIALQCKVWSSNVILLMVIWLRFVVWVCRFSFRYDDNTHVATYLLVTWELCIRPWEQVLCTVFSCFDLAFAFITHALFPYALNFPAVWKEIILWNNKLSNPCKHALLNGLRNPTSCLLCWISSKNWESCCVNNNYISLLRGVVVHTHNCIGYILQLIDNSNLHLYKTSFK